MDRIQKNNFYKEAICSLAVIIVMITIIMSIMNSNKKIELTQLQANSHRQMMGYIIKDSKGKVIEECKNSLENALVVDFIASWHLATDINANYYTK